MLNKKNIENIYPLSPMQEGMFFHALYEPDSPVYFEQTSYRVHGTLNIKLVEKSLNELFKRYDILRTVFSKKKSEKLLQIVLKERTVDFFYEDISKKEDKERYIVNFREKDKKNLFDLTQDVLMRLAVLQIGADEYEFIWSHHHILMDGWCIGILIPEFFEIYTSLFEKRPFKLPAVTPYSRYIQWLGKQSKTQSQNYWTDYVALYDEVASLPQKRAHRTGEEYKGGQVYVTLDKETTDRLNRLTVDRQVTMNTLIQSLWGILLARYTGLHDVIFGAVVSGRPSEIDGIETMVGLFINTIPMRIRFEPGTHLNQLLQTVQKNALESEPYQYYPLAMIQSHSDLKQNLFDHIVLFQNFPVEKQIEGAVDEREKKVLLKVSDVKSFERTNLDLNLIAVSGDQLTIKLDYNANAYEREWMERIAIHFERIFDQILTGKEQFVDQLTFLSKEERKQVIYDFNDTERHYPANKTIHRLFEEQAERTGDRVAIIGMGHGPWAMEGTGTLEKLHAPCSMLHAITYRELNEKSNQLAHLLRTRGVTMDGIVGIMVERSVEMVIGVLGILKAGEAYMPIAPDYPEERIKYMLEDSRAKLLLTTRNLSKEVRELGSWEVGKNKIIYLDSYKERRHAPCPMPHASQASVSLAYIIYTSGSTGIPKGVAVEHRSAVNLLFALHDAYPMSPSDAYLLKTSFLFDVSVTELFGWFLGGSRLVILAKNGEKDPKTIIDTIEAHKVTHVNFVPAMFSAFVSYLDSRSIDRIGCLKYIFVAGETLMPELVHRFGRFDTSTRLENLYGPTEGTVYASGYSLSGWKDCSTVPIGRPLPNVKLYILDTENRSKAIGEIGELCIAGAGVARGYLNHPQMTAEKSVENPFEPGTRMYRTGDLARWLPDGNIGFLGRNDYQVKIRGYRIELGEIENQLLAYEEIKETVVTTVKNKSGDLMLCAYIVSHRFGTLDMVDRAELRGFLSHRLPGYMVPFYFVFLESLPLTPNGKIDRKRLPQPEMPDEGEYVAPRTITEIKLVKVWSEVLNLGSENIGIDANFFDLGGHSLNAISMSTKVHKELNVKLELTDIFKTPTIRGLAELMKGVEEETFFSIEPVEEKEYYRISSAQKRLYLLQQMEADNIFYNIQQIIELGDKIDREKLEESMRQLIKQHEGLRTSFHMMDEEPFQKIYKEVEFRIDFYETMVNGESPQSTQDNIKNFVKPFDLSRAPLLRVGIIKRKNLNDLMMVDMHHIISDGVSQGVLEKDFINLYYGEQIPPLRLQYKDYSEWQKKERGQEKEAFRKQEDFWQEEFEGEIPVLDLPIDFPRPAIQSFEGDSVGFVLDRDTTSALKKISLDKGATLYMVLLAVTYILFSKLSRQETIVIGTPTAGRRHADLDPIIGVFLNTLALKNHPKGEKTITTFLQESKTRTLMAFENQDYPFEDLIEAVTVNRDASRNPLFDVLFTLTRFDPKTGRKIVGEGREYPELLPYEIEHNTSKFDITLEGMEFADELSFTLEYCTRLFKEETIRRFIEFFKKIVSSFLENPGQRISQIEIISEEEKQNILLSYNNTKTEYPADKTINRLFEEQAERTGDKIAIVSMEHGARSMESVSYKELDEKSNQLAHLLRTRGVTMDGIVGIMVERSVEMIVGILAILKAGGAYLPIDPDYPEERKQYMLADSNVMLLLTTRNLSKVVRKLGSWEVGKKKIIYLDSYKERRHAPCPMPHASQASVSLAYVIYTSGSTGRPKGVIVGHRNVVRLVKNTNFVQLRNDDRILQTGALEFDASTFEIWGALLNGLSLYLADKDKIVTPKALKQIIGENKITTMWMTAPLFNQLVREDVEIFGQLRNLLVGGDVLSPPHINRLRERFPHVNIINGYGPTENTTFSTTFLIDREYTERIPIGKPIANSTAYILDRYDNVQVLGINGELCVGGDGVAQGYMNDPGLTCEKFTTNPYLPGEHLYRTGDLARWLPDDGDSPNIEFSGRVDHQVKIRGFRVEPGEIEIQLLKHEKIKEAVVMVKKENADNITAAAASEAEQPDKHLCAYIVFGDALEKASGIAELREYLSHRVPDYMIPAYFVKLEEMPLTPNGKIDRNALANLEVANMEMGTGTPYAAPRNEIEEKLVETWESVLGRSQIGIREDFFMIGGDSIKAIQISSRMNTAGYQVEMRDIFQFSTIAELSPTIKKVREIADQSTITGVTPLTPIQQEYFHVPRIDPHHFNQAMMFNFKDGIEQEAVQAIFLKIQEHHDALRMTYKKDSNGTVIQENQGLDLPLSLQVFDLRQQENPGETLEAKANEIQAGINLETGPLMKLGLFYLEDGHRLLAAIHHLVVDGVSWRILFEDIETLYNQYREREHGSDVTFKLPLKTASFKTWSEKLCQYANSDSFLNEDKKYWEKLESITIHPIPKDFEKETYNYVKDTATLSFALSSRETELLLTEVNEAFGTEINDILLTAFGLGIKKTFKLHQVLIALEGHGREEIFEDVNIKRTVGWFTSLYPVVLDLSYVSRDNDNDNNNDRLSRQIKEVKEMLRQVPHKGIGYGILKYLTAKEKKTDINFQLNPRISFNYLGQFDEDVKEMSIQIAPESPGNDQGPNDERDYDLDVSGSIANRQLWMTIRYNTKHFKTETIGTLLDRYKGELVGIISYCSTRKEKELTPSDFTYDKLSIESIEALDTLVSKKI